MKKEIYRVPIDGEWDLVDLHNFPRIYRQLYSVLYSFEGNFSPDDEALLRDVYSRHPWNGGYSTLNWFNDLYNAIPQRHKPQINSMKYASPGWIDLGVIVGIAISLRTALIAVSSTFRHLNETYNQIQRGIHERKLNKLKLNETKRKLESEDLKFVKESCEQLAHLMGFKHLSQMHKRTGDPIVTLKMLLAYYRRLRELREFEQEGKTRICDKE